MFQFPQLPPYIILSMFHSCYLPERLKASEFVIICVHTCSVYQLYPTLLTPWVAAHQAPLSMGLSWEEYLTGFPFPSPGDLLDPGIQPALAGEFFTTEPPGKPCDI